MALPVELRRMRREDLPRVMEIERECFPKPWSESAYLTEISNRSAYYVVAVADYQIVGYAGMWIIMDEAHVTTLAVARTHRRLRIAEQLLVNLLDEAIRRGARRATLEVRQSNEAAQSLYRKFGFTPVALRKGYYTDNRENAIVMWVDDMNSLEFQASYRAIKQRLAAELYREAVEELA
ncbi:MAG: ribosomal protein S18-alanine N-acetyltransferase [Armatimonadetes bacterium]|nr:ribosomal protein S18-alanine N-acetyltransferase [Armatimonadota bacterium]